MTIPLLLATSHGQTQAPAERAGKGGNGGFSLDLAGAGATAAQAKRPVASPGTYPGTSFGTSPTPDTPPARAVPATAGTAGNAQVLPGNPALAEIAERMALILSAGNTAGGQGPQGGHHSITNAEAIDGLAALQGVQLTLPLNAAGSHGAPTGTPGEPPSNAISEDLGQEALDQTARETELAAQVLADKPQSDANLNGQMLPSTQVLAGQASAEQRLAGQHQANDLAERARSAEARQANPALQAGRDGLEMIRAAGERAAAQQGEPQLADSAPKATTLPDGALRSGESSRESFSTLLASQANGSANSADATFASTTHPSAQGTAATNGQVSLSAPLGSQAWPQQFTQQLSHQFGQQMHLLGQRGGEQRIELHLNPAELGPLTVSLKVSEQAAQAQFLSAHAPVRSAVEQALPQLREALAEQGISLGDTSVGEQRGQQSPEGELARRGRPGSGAMGEGAEDASGAAATAAPMTADISLDGRVDLYA
ncbi:flagellar hook-length control protein FliK [Halomonas urumqiensis]|uniref:Flagellar hook-length control protein-like C-terminal domain-containing protein n=1 Tax=Halomonas urumqiensis TaxID=1684789 RepID=A0A2N7UNQ6_9GAMM|nr:flagellar hook-length control protein FliK [Halomonas urumqiensis]PMR82083.1 hypothetical protein C1H70_02455 [Halomonas urumqiensis]PTB02585.1 hypothetical protein C6V82_08010 [Halomonas urumqiensis]GHE21066.1 flagellar hook-length control protein FliK [Halomonas urumqiensis]